MTNTRRGERGEGKVGCIVSLLLFIVAGLTVIKLLPVYMNHDQLVDYAKETAARAGVKELEELQTALLTKAKSLEIREAMAPGAIQINREGDNHMGVCTVTLKYSRTVDFYGITSVKISFDRSVTQNYMDAR
jgi:hypothetical protein